MTKTAVRFCPIRSTSALAAATRHARRQDATGKARVRPGAVVGHALSWTAYGVEDRDHLAAFRAHKATTGAIERANAPLGLQAICVIGPEWIKAHGDLHDQANGRNVLLFQQARAWAESWAGSGSVITARLDLDEQGGGVVDLTIVPIRMQRSRGGRETLRISTNAALKALCDDTNEKMSFAAAQTSWARWCQRTLDATLERGLPREMTGAKHLRPEEYGRVADEFGALREQLAALEAERLHLTRALEDARAEVVAAEAERDEARVTAHRLMESAGQSAKAIIERAERQAQDITTAALQGARTLEAKGRAWATNLKKKVMEEGKAESERMRRETIAEAEQRLNDALAAADTAGQARLKEILDRTQFIAGRLGLVKARTNAEREAEKAAITKEIREEEVSVRNFYKAAKEAADVRVAKVEARVKELARLLSDTTMERDQAQARLRALEPQRLDPDHTFTSSPRR